MNSYDLQDYVQESFPKFINIVKRVTDGYTMKFFHWHPHYEISIITGGFYTAINNGQIITNQGSGILIHCPYSLHNANAEKGQNYERYVISFGKRFKEIFPDNFFGFSALNDSTLIYAVPNALEQNGLVSIAEKLLECDDDRISALYIAQILCRTFNIVKSGRGEIFRSHVTYIQDVLRYVTENLSEPKTIEALAARYHVGQSKFYSDFKVYTGSTYKKYLTTLRQTRARELLESGAGIMSASLECGYSSEAHFIKVFRDYWGVTPGVFKRGLGIMS